ncbi:MAG: hypothetical protein AVDCRST_MAG55-1946 [uncultured Rubrobacteraceae bacterium]|uniref:Uncharacterized protein n=1 Tax=uncultured Rubrobacteraceae bacterium TaxID=349277 RepID=A0A6J4PMW9_9ACTN|nr:MAG: hypothetical protein AVDCRST_MAG55-1946 [uncultured Rubrobacteraceae bacterium]
MGPIRTGLFYGALAAVVAFVAELYFLFLDPSEVAGWVLAVIGSYRTRLLLAVFLFLGILAALGMRPVRLDPDASYRSLLLRDGALAATVVALVVGVVLAFTTLLQATVLADDMRAYARESAPKVVSYVNGVRDEIQQRRREEGQSPEEVNDVPPPAELAEVEESFGPPAPRDLGRSLANFVLRAILLGTVGGLVGLLRGRSKTGPDASSGPG